MKKIFLIVEETSTTSGINESESKLSLATHSGSDSILFPAFTNKNDAEDFMKTVDRYWRVKIIEIDLFVL